MGRHSSHHSSHSSRSSSYRSGGTAIVPVPLPAPVPVPVPLPAPVPESCYRERREDVDLVRRFNRECRNSGYPTRYIVNDGTLVINESLLNDSNTLIYNRRGSNMWVRPDGCCSCDGSPSCRCGCRGRGCCRGGRWGRGGYCPPGGGSSVCYCSTTRITTTRYTEYCCICRCRRVWQGGYCRECAERRCIPPWYLREPREPIRPLFDGPSRRLLDWR
ncbi:hypothetical protein PG990_007048 [Apiospora arundinis]|uniref:Uncharacterized protein n=1 Tax=Apiospora arundinis TaxID=335852 RepID=A0ABR2JC07_9PEZI